MKRREILKSLIAAATGLSLGVASSAVMAADPIVIGLPLNQTGPVGVVDHEDHLNGTILAIEEARRLADILVRRGDEPAHHRTHRLDRNPVERVRLARIHCQEGKCASKPRGGSEGVDEHRQGKRHDNAGQRCSQVHPELA